MTGTEIFLWAYFIVLSIGTILRIVNIYSADYPIHIHRGTDILILLLTIPVLVWVSVLIF